MTFAATHTPAGELERARDRVDEFLAARVEGAGG